MVLNLGRKIYKTYRNSFVYFAAKMILSPMMLISCSFGQEPMWFVKIKQLKPAFSNKTEVEEILETKKVLKTVDFSKIEKKGWTRIVTYSATDGFLEVRYSTGNCSERKSLNGLDIDKDILVSLDFFSFKKAPVKLFDLDGYTYQTTDIVSAFIYQNESKRLFLYGNHKKVGQVSLGITVEQAKKLSCKLGGQ